MFNSTKSISAFILSGGKSSRMGQEKGLALFRGRPMIQPLLEVLSGLDFRPTIVGHHPGYQHFGVPVVKDLVPEKGPLGGIYTSLIHCESSHALILSCDSPLIAPDTLLNLISQAQKVLTVGRLEGKVYPFPGIYSKVLLPELSRCLAVNELRVQSFIAQHDHHLLSLEEISSSPKEEFANFNSPGDIMLWEKLETEVKPIG